jgi:hypothetical protein
MTRTAAATPASKPARIERRAHMLGGTVPVRLARGRIGVHGATMRFRWQVRPNSSVRACSPPS